MNLSRDICHDGIHNLLYAIPIHVEQRENDGHEECEENDKKENYCDRMRHLCARGFVLDTTFIELYGQQ